MVLGMHTFPAPGMPHPLGPDYVTSPGDLFTRAGVDSQAFSFIHEMQVWLAQVLRNTLLIDSHVRSINYNVDCVAGTIYLMGVAQDQTELQRVIDHARDIPYVRGVVSYVRLKNDPIRQPPPAPVQPAAATP